jgi:LVIVD repeat
MRRSLLAVLVSALFTLGLAGPAGATGSFRMNLLFELQNATGAVNSDLAFWGDRAYAGNYDGFRIFDISNPSSPQLVTDFRCFGPQNDVSVWDRDGNGKADLLITSIDRTLAGPACGSPAVAHGDTTGWEGLRIFDISDEKNPVMIRAVYQDCGSHTHTLIPQPGRGRLLVLNESYPLRAGPTCGPVNGPAVGRDPLHGVIQVVEIPLDDPADAGELTELPITYPGDADNKYLPLSERGLAPPGTPDLIDGMRACHDVTVFMELRLVAAACAEQIQLWRMDADGLPDTAHPVWVYDQHNVDFWHSATFSWDGKVVNGIDESFGEGCPSETELPTGETVESGNTFFFRTGSGAKLSEFRMPRAETSDPVSLYCSAHLGVPVPMPGRNLLVNAWYTAGVDVIDFTAPRNPREIAFFDDDGDNWSGYWYEPPGVDPGSDLTIYASDGVENPPLGDGFQVYSAQIQGQRIGLDHLNPQTQEKVIKTTSSEAPDASAPSAGPTTTRRANGQGPRSADRTSRASVVAHLAP